MLADGGHCGSVPQGTRGMPDDWCDPTWDSKLEKISGVFARQSPDKCSFHGNWFHLQTSNRSPQTGSTSLRSSVRSWQVRSLGHAVDTLLHFTVVNVHTSHHSTKQFGQLFLATDTAFPFFRHRKYRKKGMHEDKQEQLFLAQLHILPKQLQAHKIHMNRCEKLMLQTWE